MLLPPAVRTARVKVSRPAAIKEVTVVMVAEATIAVVEIRTENEATINLGGQVVPRPQHNSSLPARQMLRTSGTILVSTRFKMSNFKRTARLAS